MNLQELMKANSLNKFYAKVKGTTLVEAMFPMEYNNDFDLNIISGVGNQSVRIIQHSNFDADILARDWGFKVHAKEGKEFFRERMSLDEKTRMTLLQFISSGDKELIENYSLQIYEQFAGKNGFLASVRALATYTVSQLLSTGKVLYINENGGGREADYRLDNSLKETLTLTNVWTNPASSPIADLNRWKDTVEEKGKTVEVALMNKKTFNLLKNHAKVVKLIEDQKLLPTKENFITVIEKMTDLKIVIWDEKINVGGVERTAFPDNVVTLIPNGRLGKMEYGPTPTKTDKIYGLAGGRDIVDITGTYAPLEVAAIQKHSTVTNVDVVIEAMLAPNPTIMDSMFIGTVA